MTVSIFTERFPLLSAHILDQGEDLEYIATWLRPSELDKADRMERYLNVQTRIQRARAKGKLTGYRANLLASCEWCRHVPEELSELEVDHADGDHQNNALENLITLCATCHKRKTAIYRDFDPAPVREIKERQLTLFEFMKP